MSLPVLEDRKFLGSIVVDGTTSLSATTLSITAPTFTVGAESTNVIAVTFSSPVASVEQYLAELHEDATGILAVAAAFTMAETGAGAEVSTTAKPRLIFTTSAAGAATLSVTDVATGSGKKLWLKVEPLFTSADTAQTCAAGVTSLTFD